MQDTFFRSARIWFFTNLMGSLFFCIGDIAQGEAHFGIFPLMLFVGLIFSFSVVFTSAIGISRLKKLPESLELRFGIMVLTGLVSVCLVVLLVSLIDRSNEWDFDKIVDTAKFLSPYCIAGIVTSIFFTRDLIFFRPEKTLIQPHENTEL